MMEDLTLWNGLRHDDMGQALLEINLSNNNINGMARSIEHGTPLPSIMSMRKLISSCLQDPFPPSSVLSAP